MKRILAFLLALTLILSLTGCIVKKSSSATVVGNIEITNDKSIYMKYSLFDGERTYTISAKEPLSMRASFTTTKGTLHVELGKDGEEPVFKANIIDDNECTIRLTQAGEYTLRLNADNHGGSYNFEWTKLTDNESATETTTEASTQAPASTTAAFAAEAALVADYAEGKAPDFDDAVGSEYACVVSFSVDSTVQDFRYLQIAPDVDEDGNLLVSDSKALYSRDTLTPDKPILIGLEFHGTLPDRAVCYTDNCGKTHTFALLMSGENGDVLLQSID